MVPVSKAIKGRYTRPRLLGMLIVCGSLQQVAAKPSRKKQLYPCQSSASVAIVCWPTIDESLSPFSLLPRKAAS